METVKMPVTVQAKAGTVSRSVQTELQNQSQSFVKLLQEKKDMAEPDRAQTGTADKKKEPVRGGDDKTDQTGEPEKKVQDKVPENGDGLEDKDGVTQEALLQAGVWQAAAQIKGMLAEDVQSDAAGAEEEILVSSDSEVPVVSLDKAGGSEVQEAVAAAADSMMTETTGQDAVVETAVSDAGVYQADEKVPGEKSEWQAEETVAEAGETERTVETRRNTEAPQVTAAAQEETARIRKDSAETVHGQEETENQSPSPDQEKGGTWQSAGRDAAVAEKPGERPDEKPAAAKVQTGDSQVRQDRKAERETAREPVYRTDSVREPSWQSLGSRRTEEIPLRTSESHLPQDLGKTLAARLPGNGRELVIELEPAALGKLTIKLAYEGGRAAVSILASNPRTLEVLSQRASEIAAILEEKTGQDTIIYTHAPEQQQNQDQQEQQDQGGGRQEQRQDQQKRQDEQNQTESFAQQLRLGLI